MKYVLVTGYMPNSRRKAYMKLTRKFRQAYQTFKELTIYDVWFWLLLDLAIYSLARHYVMHTLDTLAPLLIGH